MIRVSPAPGSKSIGPANGGAFFEQNIIPSDGEAAAAALTELKNRGCSGNIKLMVLVAAPEGIARIQKEHPDVDIYCGAVDQGLNERGYIVPGLGDAGDRVFGTK